MTQACALYFPTDKLDFKSVLPKGRSDGGIFRAPTWFEFDSDHGVVRLNLRHENLLKHLQGFRGYVAQLPDDAASRARAQELISRTKAAVGVILQESISPESEAFVSLMALLKRFDGFMFVANSILLPSGDFLVGPMVNRAKEHSAREAMRERNYQALEEKGFRSARWLPLYRGEEGAGDVLRPVEEIAARLLALSALFLWVAAPEDIASSDALQGFIQRNQLAAHLTEEEAEILDMPRDEANEEFVGTIGWRLENMWALAWILGFEPAPPFFQGPLPQEITDRILFEFLPKPDGTLAEFVRNVQPRNAADVAQLEDLFYCTHNAVRSAQMGEDTVPEGFHPVVDGGAIHERRHSLTWSLSPGTSWDDTDVST